MHLAYFSPLNPVESGISDYSEELLPCLAAWAEIDLFVDGYQPSNPSLGSFAIHDVRRYAALASRYDAVIYQMGNSPAHAYIYRTLLRHPGVVVLHEHVLHHLISWMSWDRGDARSYLGEFRYCYGREGEALARRVILGQTEIDGFDYPLSDRAIRAARGLIVHSEFVRRAVLPVRPDAQVRVVPMGIPLPAERSDQGPAARRRLGLSADTLVVGSFGHINPFKRLDLALRSFRALLKTNPRALYVLVGSVSANYDVVHIIRMLGLEKNVLLAGYADAQTFRDYVSATDICINLRYPTAGETSASVLRLMAAGLPVLVSRSGAFEELPDGTCVKIDVDAAEGDLVLEYLRLLADDPDLRRVIGANARRYVAEEHSMEKAARGYVEALRAWYSQQAPEHLLHPLPLMSTVASSSAPPQTEVRDAGDRQEAEAGSAPTLESAVFDLVAGAAQELGLGDSVAGLRDAAEGWVDLARKS